MAFHLVGTPSRHLTRHGPADELQVISSPHESHAIPSITSHHLVTSPCMGQDVRRTDGDLYGIHKRLQDSHGP
jgi:hypothetical protein